jgi:imidazolonepropionase-like amidohydrolase
MTGASAARALRRSDVGTIEAGRLADLVLLTPIRRTTSATHAALRG